jgi:F-type H+-transporting ATPase subunit epsilon
MSVYCQLLAAEGCLFAGEATLVVAHSPRGEFAVMEGHAPLLAVLDVAPLRIKTDQGERVFALLEGFLRVDQKGVVIVAKQAIPEEAVDLAAVQKRHAEVEEELRQRPKDERLGLERAGLRVQEQIKERHV